MESNLQQNFNVGFTNMKSDVLVHLTQWQYWWWFWFSLLWAFYYLMIIKMVRFRSLKFRPRLATTLRPHGKWGDLIVCIIPVSWCANIITNSNFILRMIEWQSESGALTVRIRGKQWYWVYKFELKTLTDVFTIPKNIGHNKWQIATPNDLQVADDYLHILQLRSQNRWVKSYWDDLSKEMNKSKNFHMISPKEFVLDSFDSAYKKINNTFNSDQISPVTEHSVNGSTHYFDRVMVADKLKVMLQMVEWLDGKASDIFENPRFSLFEDLENEDSDEDSVSNVVDTVNNVVDTVNNVSEENEVLQPTSNPVSEELSNGKKEEKKDPFETIYDFSGEEVDKFIKILNDNLFKKSDLIALIKYSDMNKILNVDTTLVLPSYLRDYKDHDYVNIPTGSMEEFKSYLKLITSFELNGRYLNFKFLHDMTSFLEESLLKKVTDPVEKIFLNYKCSETKESFLERQELMGSITSSDRVGMLFNFDLGVDSDFFNDTFSEKSWLSSYHNYDDILVRLSNKKSNWDESSLADSLDEQYKWFLSNEDIFNSRSDEVESIDYLIEKTTLNPEVFYDENIFSSYTYSDFNEFDRNSRKSQGTTSPVRLIKYPISNKTNFDTSSDVIKLFRFRFNELESSTEHRITPNSAFLIIRQKRYKRRKVILPRTIFYKDDDGNFTKRVKSSNYTFLSQNSIILENDFNATKRYKFFKKSKSRDELTNLVLSKRILRTRRTLVLPAHLNITAITNSFDVIHSWFIPGLGLKMDAIPGRATHHTFYIDNVGFYYGQCAEICGRYHHHMPIRICALPFEHFLLWWQSFGLPKLLFTKNFRRYSYSYGSRKYAW